MMLGLAVVTGARVVAPQGVPPLYDSVVIPSPYIYLHPSPGQQGNPAGASATLAVSGHDAGAISLATKEAPPQAQLLIAAGSPDMPGGAQSVTVTIAAGDPPHARPPTGIICGH